MTGSEAPPPAANNPAAAADAEQHALQQIAGLQRRSARVTRSIAWSAAAMAGGVLSGWLLRRWRRRK